MSTVLTKNFYHQDTLFVAKNLIGKMFFRKINSKILNGIIVETEAYHQNNDLSCHANRGKTKRNQVMFETGGHLYVYFTYGMHYCMNIVTENEGIGSAVLIRAIQPVQGIEIMQKNRKNPKNYIHIANGPAKCCQALSISTIENGKFLYPTNNIWIEEFFQVDTSEIAITKRIGISKSKELPWRFYLKKNEYISKK